MHDVFISYSSKDKVVADAVCAKLEQEKIRCWIAPRDILPSSTYGKSIIDAINQSSLMVLIFSKNSHNSDQVLREVERSVTKGVPILPLRIEDIFPEGDMEYFLSTVHWLDAIDPPFETHIQILTEKVKKLLEFEKNSGDLKTEASNELSLEKFIFDEKSVEIDFNDIYLNEKESFLEEFELSHKWQIENITKKIIEEGRLFINNSLPMARFGDLIEVNPLEIENYHNISNIITNYLKNENSQNPLSLAVFGPPSSGKSFAIIQITKSIANKWVETLYFDVSVFTSPADITNALKSVQNVEKKGKIPLVFFKKFDLPFNDKEYGWLKFFLDPMESGVFNVDGTLNHIKRAIFVFETGAHESFQDFSYDNQYEINQFKRAGGSDFVSRLRAYLNVLGPNKCFEDDLFFRMRRAVLLRSILEKNAKNIIGDDQKANISRGILRAFLHVPKYKHGVRSIEAIIEMSMLSDKNIFDQSALPPKQQLDIHLDATIFLKLVASEPLFGSVFEKMAMEIHEDYRRMMMDSKSNDSEAMKPWEDLSSDLKESNHQQAQKILVKLQEIDYDVIPCISEPKPFEFSHEQIEKLAQIEHEQWMDERLSQGWRYDHRITHSDHYQKLSPHLVPWEKLPEKYKDMDRHAVRNMPTLLKKAGFEIYSLK